MKAILEVASRIPLALTFHRLRLVAFASPRYRQTISVPTTTQTETDRRQSVGLTPRMGVVARSGLFSFPIQWRTQGILKLNPLIIFTSRS
jgi:hypothetical protein